MRLTEVVSLWRSCVPLEASSPSERIPQLSGTLSRASLGTIEIGCVARTLVVSNGRASVMSIGVVA